MRSSIIGLVVGAVLGVILGATVIAPRLQRANTHISATERAPAPTATEIVKQLPRALVPKPAVSWRMTSGFPLDTSIAATLARRIDSRIWEVSHGQIEIRPDAPGATISAAADLSEAVGSNAIDTALTVPGTGQAKVPALRIFTGVPFGPDADEFLAWLEFGGGRELLDEINHGRDVHGIVCGFLPPPAFGWFRRELQAPQDLKGLRMSIEGLGAKVLARLGVEVVDLSPGDLMLALEQGAIDAVSYASPVIDQRMEFGTWLKNYYPQGWQSPTTLELMINLQQWERLNASQRAQVDTTCGDNVRYSLAAGDAGQFQALKDIVGRDVSLHRLSPAIREALERAWQQVVYQENSNDPEFRRVWQSLTDFRNDFAVWRELGRP